LSSLFFAGEITPAKAKRRPHLYREHQQGLNIESFSDRNHFINVQKLSVLFFAGEITPAKAKKGTFTFFLATPARAEFRLVAVKK
jgi:hypothetical protein